MLLVELGSQSSLAFANGRNDGAFHDPSFAPADGYRAGRAGGGQRRAFSASWVMADTKVTTPKNRKGKAGSRINGIIA